MVKDVQSLIDSGFDPDSILCSGMTPLMTAVFNGHRSMVSRLLELGANPSLGVADGACDPIYLAVSLANADIARLLIRAGSDLSRRYPPHSTSLLGIALEQRSLVPILVRHNVLLCAGDIRYVFLKGLLPECGMELGALIDVGKYDSTISQSLLTVLMNTDLSH